MSLWPTILNRSSLKVGIGKKVSFREDSWIGQCLMKLSYPDIYNLCKNQEQQATVDEMWPDNGWDFISRRLLNDWEISRMTEFLSTLGQFQGLTDSEDCIVWKGDSRGRFSVKSAYRDFNRSNDQVECWPWKLMWKVKILYKVSCFVWLLANGAVLTQDNLRKEGISTMLQMVFYVRANRHNQPSFYTKWGY